jgi:hypothetical protein
MALNLRQFEEQVFFTTVRITSERKDGKGSSVGTGFLYVHRVNEKKEVLLLISNRHVFQGSKNISFQFNKRQKTRKLPKLGDIMSYTIPELGATYFEHPDKETDLACLNISIVANDKINKVFFKNLHSDMLLHKGEEDLHAGSPVWFVGYPENRFDVQNNLPILRSGTIASMPSMDFNGKRQLIIDAQVFPGSSGSPVFAAVGDRYKLIGVVAQTMVRNQELHVVPAVAGVGVEQVLGLGIVIKARELSKLFKLVSKKITPSK